MVMRWLYVPTPAPHYPPGDIGYVKSHNGSWPCGNVAVLKKPFEGPPTRNNTQKKLRFSTTEWKFLKTRAYRFPHTKKRKGYFRIPYRFSVFVWTSDKNSIFFKNGEQKISRNSKLLSYFVIDRWQSPFFCCWQWYLLQLLSQILLRRGS